MRTGKWRRLIAPGLTALVVFCILMALGFWQLQRLQWKQGIIASIRAAQEAAPVPLPANPTPFEKVQIAGSWIPGKAALYGDEVHDTLGGPVEGADLIMALRRPNGEVVLTDLGWVPQTTPRAIDNLQPNAVGYLHAPMTEDFFTGTDDPAHRLFYTLDPQKIGVGLGLDNIAPFMLIALGPMPPPGSPLPQPAQDLPTPPNNHYEYALTWFGFAGVLIFQFIFFARKRLLAS